MRASANRDILRGREFLDDRALAPELAIRSLRDIARSNRLFGGTRAVLAELRDDLRADGTPHARPLTVFDAGTGAGDIPFAIREAGRRNGCDVRTVGLEWTAPLARAAAPLAQVTMAGDARALPIARGAFDIAVCAQVLHHFSYADALTIVCELDRIARRRVVIGEIRRTVAAAAGIWLASWPLGFHPVSRHDGVVSVFRGFTVTELAALVHDAIGVAPVVRRHAGFRVTASWVPRGKP
ncbi:MAG: methyltransferase domain-containing protein [Gemmatimonadetes bacterium]|nr:methyltransferase domain-containing protein [Gemmatimonadota bacterium]